jgi:hypothetical protein
VTDDHLLRINDQTSQGVSGCGGDTDRWAVTAHVSSYHDQGTPQQTPALTNAGDTDFIPASSMMIVTTTQVNTDNIDNQAGPAISAATNGLYYDDYVISGQGRSTEALSQAGGTNFTLTGLTGTYDIGSNTLDNPVLLLKHCPTGTTGEDSDIYTGVAMAIDNGIHTRQAEGTYTGTIEYDWLPSTGVTCP